MEHENQQLKNRVSALQADLETSEAVQRDFVQLSQQLQVVALCLVSLKTNRRKIVVSGPIGKNSSIREGTSMAIRRGHRSVC